MEPTELMEPMELMEHKVTQGPLGNISDICPTDTSLQLRFVSEVLSDAYIVTCSLGNPFVYVTWADDTPGNTDLFTICV